MRKILWIICLLLITGCNKENIIVDKPLSIVYNTINIVENDYNWIIDKLNNLEFNCGKSKNISGNLLSVTTNYKIYKFHISSNYYMEFKKNDKYCYTKDTEKVNDLLNNLEKLNQKYRDITFYNIRTEQNYDDKEKDIIIKLDRENDFTIINSIYPLNNFKINEIEYDNENQSYTETDLIYSNDILETNNDIIIRKQILHNPNFKISFTTQYNYLVTILPILNENNEVNYITNIEKNS